MCMATIDSDVQVEVDGEYYSGVVVDTDPDEMMFEVDLDGFNGTNWFDHEDVEEL